VNKLFDADTAKSSWTEVQPNVRFGPKADMGPTSDEYGNARQDNPDLRELARLCIDFD
jgi:hypothetical protein